MRGSLSTYPEKFVAVVPEASPFRSPILVEAVIATVDDASGNCDASDCVSDSKSDSPLTASFTHEESSHGRHCVLLSSKAARHPPQLMHDQQNVMTYMRGDDTSWLVLT